MEPGDFQMFLLKVPEEPGHHRTGLEANESSDGC